MPQEVEMGMSFPTKGVDQSTEFGRQPNLTAPDALNVQAYDTLAERERGGSRAGITRWIDETVNGPHLIQHLNILVDPTPDVLASSSDGEGSSDEIDDPSDAGRNLLDDGSVRRVRRRGSAFRHRHPVAPSSTYYRQRAFNGFLHQLEAFPPFTVAFTQTPETHSLLVAIVRTYSNRDTSATVAVTSNALFSPSYTQVGTYNRVDTGSGPDENHIGLSMWYRRIATSSADEKVANIVPAFAINIENTCDVTLLEYRLFQSAPLDQYITQLIMGATTTFPSGTVPVAGANELVIAAFDPNNYSTIIPDAGTIARANGASETESVGNVVIADKLFNGPGSTTCSGVRSFSNNGLFLLTIAASFKR